MTVVVGTTEELDDDLTDRGLAWIGSAGMYGWVHANDGSGIGIWFADASAWPDVVVRVTRMRFKRQSSKGPSIGELRFRCVLRTPITP